MKRIAYFLTLLLLTILLVACSDSGDSNNEEHEVVQISVERTGNLLTGIGKVKVYIDDEEVMKVKNDKTETVELSLLPGIHTIQTKGQGDKSDVVEFEVVAGGENVFEYNTEISNIYGVKLTLLNNPNPSQNKSEPTEEPSQEESEVSEIGEIQQPEEVQQPTEISKVDEYIQKLNKIEDGLSDLEYLYANGITSEMTQAESITYERWDNALNEIYGVLKEQLSASEMDALRQEQRQWIIDRDQTAEAESLAFEGGTMESLQYISTQARITKERCYELVTVYMK